jgi:SNF2 family DNA or RNA helicase
VTEVCDTCSSHHPLGQFHEYQDLAVDFLRRQPRAALMMDMGLGKTASVLAALEDRHLPALVTAPKRVAEEVWDVEQERWRPDLGIAVAAGDPAKRKAALLSDAPIVVLGRDNLRDLDSLKPRDREPFRTFVIDELSGFKSGGNRGSVRWKAARRQIKKETTANVWGLTGTPAPNGYLDLWGQISLLDGGERLGKSFSGYRDRYFVVDQTIWNGTREVAVSWAPREFSIDRIKERIEDICLAMKSEGRITLPPLTFNDVAIELPPAVRKAYREFSDELTVNLKDLFGGEVHTAGNAAILTSRLSQMTAGFLYVDDAEIRNYEHTVLHSEKIKALEEIAESPRVGGLLVFYRYTAERDMILKHFGDAAHTLEEDGVVKAWNRQEIPILLTHPASAGHGLNLQHGGHTAVWTSPTWDLEHFDQGNKRLARQGQKHPVVIHMILAKKSIDHLIRNRLVAKSDTQQDLLAFLESPI